MTKSAQKHQDQLKNLILTGVVAGLTFTLLLLAVLPFVAGKETVENVLPTYETVSEESEAASGSLACASWQNVKINGCTLADYNKGAAHCTTNKPNVILNLKSANADTVAYKEFTDANSTYCENAKPDSESWDGWTVKKISSSANLPVDLSNVLKAGDRKFCVRFFNSKSWVQSYDNPNSEGAMCGATIKYRPASTGAISPAVNLKCDSWTSVKINNCTLAEWNNSGSSACTTNSNNVTLNLSPDKAATHYRYKFAGYNNDCVKQNLTQSTWTAIPTNKKVSLALPSNKALRKICVQYSAVQKDVMTGAEAGRSTSPICGASIRQGLVRDQ